MPIRLVLAVLLMSAAIGPADAQQQQRGGIQTETQERIANQGLGNDLIWNLIGLFGLLGLLGFKKEHSDDSYHPSPLD